MQLQKNEKNYGYGLEYYFEEEKCIYKKEKKKFSTLNDVIGYALSIDILNSERKIFKLMDKKSKTLIAEGYATDLLKYYRSQPDVSDIMVIQYGSEFVFFLRMKDTYEQNVYEIEKKQVKYKINKM